jgi:hypothetical protein
LAAPAAELKANRALPAVTKTARRRSNALPKLGMGLKTPTLTSGDFRHRRLRVTTQTGNGLACREAGERSHLKLSECGSRPSRERTGIGDAKPMVTPLRIGKSAPNRNPLGLRSTGVAEGRQSRNNADPNVVVTGRRCLRHWRSRGILPISPRMPWGFRGRRLVLTRSWRYRQILGRRNKPIPAGES